MSERPTSPNERPTTRNERPTTHTLDLAAVDLVYDVHRPIHTADGRPLLVMVGQPMCADGFQAIASHFPDRTVVTYDPRGLGRSTTRRDGRDDQRPEDQAADLHALVRHLGTCKVDVFASSGGAVAGLTWASLYPDDVATLLAHEPPSTWALPDAQAADQAFRAVRQAYQDRGFGAGMAAFLALTMWQGEFTEEYFARPAPDPAMFGMPAADDGGRDDPLLSGRAVTVTRHAYDIDALKAGPTRVVLGVGEETGDSITGRTTRAIARRLGQQPVVFPSHHGGFVGGDGPYAGKPAAFADTLRAVLDGAR